MDEATSLSYLVKFCIFHRLFLYDDDESQATSPPAALHWKRRERRENGNGGDRKNYAAINNLDDLDGDLSVRLVSINLVFQFDIFTKVNVGRNERFFHRISSQKT